MRRLFVAASLCMALAIAAPVNVFRNHHGSQVLSATSMPVASPVAPAPTNPSFPSGWYDLFPPPYNQAPSIMMAISALTNTTQYVPGGSNNQGFTVYSFNGDIEGNFNPLNMPQGALMIMALAATGTPANPKGIVAGLGIGNGVQYFANATTLLPSKVPTLFVECQDVRIARDGATAIAVDSAGSNAVLVSHDGGATFSENYVNITGVNSSITFLRYGAVVDSKTIYVTAGSWPNNAQTTSNRRRHKKDNIRLSETRTVVRRRDGSLRVKQHAPMTTTVAPAATSAGSGSGSAGGLGYTAMLAKSTNGGKTWTAAVNINNGNFYFNGIDCFDATHCIAVGEGFNEGAGGHIWLTEDGVNWKEVFFAESSSAGQYSFMSVRYSGKDGKEAWVGGSFMISQIASNGLFMHTSDGGKTWKEYPHGLPNIGDISSISFLADGTGFATGLTIDSDSTILRFDPRGPPPPGFFIQSQCVAANCTYCQNISVPQDMCLPAGNGSAIVTCSDVALVQQNFNTSDCTGPSQMSTAALDTCLGNSNEGWFANFCPKKAPQPSSKPTMAPKPHRFVKKH